MALATLPPDGLRLITNLLDLESMARLFATLNRRMQIMLSSPGILHNLVLQDFEKHRGKRFMYFIKSLRNVKRLQITSSTMGVLGHKDSSWLSSLNPLELKVNSEILFRQHLPNGDDDPDAMYNGPPLPASLRRLTTLILDADNDIPAELYLQQQAEDLYPATLTSVSVFWYGPPPLSILDHLPKTLKSLSMSLYQSQRTFDCPHCHALTRYNELESLTVSFTDSSIELADRTPAYTLPPSLRTLKFIRVLADAALFDTLPRLLANCPQLATFTIEAIDTSRAPRIDRGIPPCALAHPNLLHMVYNKRPDDVHDADIISFPLSLVSLTTTITLHWDRFVQALPNLKVLEKLKLTSGDRRGFVLAPKFVARVVDEPAIINPPVEGRPFAIPCTLLPSSLRHLEFDNVEPPKSSEIECLPTNLRLLAVSVFILSAHSDLVKRAPSCRLSMVKPARIWHTENTAWSIENDMAPYWSSTVDVNAWMFALRRKAAQLGIYCGFDRILGSAENVEISFPSDMKILKFGSASDPEVVRWNLAPYLEKAVRESPQLEHLVLRTPTPVRLPSSLTQLTHLELCDSPIEALPALPQLQHLSSSITHSIRATNAPAALQSLTSLDVPNWRIPWYFLKNWNLKDMKMLRMTLADISDFKVVDFLTRHLTPQTRLNSSLAIEYYATGSLLPETGSKATRHFTWTSMVEETEAILNSQLSSRMPSGFFSTRATNAATDTIGSCVTSLKRVKRFGDISQIVLPRSAVTIHLEETDINIEMTNSVLSKLCFADPQSPVKPHTEHRLTPIFGQSLVLLDVTKPIYVSSWLPSLPSTLKFLRFSAVHRLTLMHINGMPLPPTLNTLIINWLPMVASEHISIPFTAYWCAPPSLEHFALYVEDTTISAPFAASTVDQLALNLPNLKTFYIPCH